jgi:hypothetical protein
MAVLMAVAAPSPALAFYTECTVARDADLSIRPDGPTEPRYSPVSKGDKVAYRARYEGWWFVLHYNRDQPDYGWLPHNILINCQKRDGTP